MPVMEETRLQTSDFAARWTEYTARISMGAKFALVKLPAHDGRLSQSCSLFLFEVGMPEASGLRFDPLAGSLEKVYEVYGSADYWKDADRKRLDDFLVIGSNQGGDPLCLDRVNHERIVLLDHERNFAVAEFVNSSVLQLAECILIFQEMVEKFQNEHGEEAELYEGNVPILLVEQTLSRIGSIDSSAIGQSCYWPTAMDYI